MNMFLNTNKLWRDWHRSIYSDKTTLSNEEMLADELANGINFRKLLGPENIN